MRNGYIMLEWLIAICLTALLLTGVAPLLGQSLRAVGQIFAQLYCARESMQIAGIVDSYLYDADITERPGNHRTLSFVKYNQLPQRWIAQPRRLYLELSDGQWQPLTVIGAGTMFSPAWAAGESGENMFTVYDGGFVEYACHWKYGNHRFTIRGGICPLKTSYSIGGPYVYR